MIKIIININSNDANIKYTSFNKNNNFINTYYGCVQAFQNGSNKGQSKHYYNDNGVLKIECSKWKNENIPQTPENRRDKNNWDENTKVFIVPEICLKKLTNIYKSDVIDDKEIILYFNNIKYVLLPKQHITFGTVDKPEIKIF